MSGDEPTVSLRGHKQAKEFQKAILDLIERTSIDWLSPATRAVLDKLLIFSLTAIALCALKNPTTSSFLGIALGELSAPWILPMAAAVIVAFYTTSLIVLARADYKRWDALFSIHLAKVVQVFETAMTSVGHLEQMLGEYEDSASKTSLEKATNSGAETIVTTENVIDLMDMLNRHLKFAQKTLQPGNELHKQAKRLMWLYVVLPAFFSVVSILALLYLTWSLYRS